MRLGNEFIPTSGRSRHFSSSRHPITPVWSAIRKLAEREPPPLTLCAIPSDYWRKIAFTQVTPHFAWRCSPALSVNRDTPILF